MSDLIKREDAIETIHNYWKKRLDTLPTADIQQIDKILEHNKTLCNFIDAIPSADRPQGEWEIEYRGNGWNDYWDYTCSNCGKKYERADAVLYKANFCPNCGAKMKGADNETD